MPRPKGLAKTGGRKPGVPNKRTRELRAAVSENGMLPIEYMLSVMRDPKVEPERRDRMAAAVAPYLHPRLQAVLAKIDSSTDDISSDETPEERARRAREEIDRAFAEREALTIDHQPAPVGPPAQGAPSGDDQPDVPQEEPEAPQRPSVRDFARDGALKAAPGIQRLPTRYRRARSIGQWSG